MRDSDTGGTLTDPHDIETFAMKVGERFARTLNDPDAIRRECAEAAIAYMTDNTQLGINLIGLRQSIMNAGKE